MKEQLNTLKNSVQQVVKGCEHFKKQREFFNMKVEEKLLETGAKEIILSEDSYESAKTVCVDCNKLHETITKIRNEHPKYGNRRIKDLVITEIMSGHENYNYTSQSNFLGEIIDNYFIYESCGFFKLLKQEQELQSLEKEVTNATDAILDESKEAAIKAGKAVVNVVKPYGDVAKSQFNDASSAAKKAVNKGSQKLKLFFEGLEEKTRQK